MSDTEEANQETNKNETSQETPEKEEKQGAKEETQQQKAPLASEDKWTDPGTGKELSFNEEGMFVDEEGKGPQKGFKNDNNFGDWLHKYVQNRMVKEYGLSVKKVADDVPIYHTKDAFNSPKKLLCLICGAGRIMAGLWSVGVCAYHGLNAGSVLPCLRKAAERNMEVIVFNPNHRKAMTSSHSKHIFADLIIPNSPPDQRVWILSHSMGGSSTCSIVSSNPKWCIDHVAAIAMTDGCEGSVHAKGYQINKWCHLKGINWVQSKEELNSELKDGQSTKHRSAATSDHPLTTFKALPFVWEFFDANGANSDQSPPLPEDFVGEEVIEPGQECNIA